MKTLFTKKRLAALLLVLVLMVPVLASAAWYRVNTTSLKVRFLPDQTATVLGSYRHDYALTIKSKHGDWYYVAFSDGFEGYIQSKYVKKSSSYRAWITNDDTALRLGPAYSFSTAGTLAKGTRVTVLTHGSNYDYVSSPVGNGYVMNRRLSKKKVSPSGNANTSTGAVVGGYTAYLTRKVNLRQAPNDKAVIITSYPEGTAVTVLVHGASWDQVQVNGQTGYMANRFLSTAVPAPTAGPTAAPAPAPSYTAYVVTPNGKPVNGRNGPGTGYGLVFSAGIPYGAAVTVVEHDVTWDKCIYKGKTVYIMSKFLQTTAPQGYPQNSPEPGPTDPVFPFQMTVWSANGGVVNCHNGPGLGYSNSKVGQLMPGTTVNVIGQKGKWYQIEYQGNTGWIRDDFLR